MYQQGTEEEEQEEEEEEDTEGSAAPTVRAESQVTGLHRLATPFPDGTRRLAARARLPNRSYQDWRPTPLHRVGCVSSLLCVSSSQFIGCAGAWFSSAVPGRSSRGAGGVGLEGTPDRFPFVVRPPGCEFCRWRESNPQPAGCKGKQDLGLVLGVTLSRDSVARPAPPCVRPLIFPKTTTTFPPFIRGRSRDPR